MLSLILREELDLREVELAEIVLAYVDHLESKGELDLEATTEFLVLIAALLELKSRLLLPGEPIEEVDELEVVEAADELFERLVQYARFRGAGFWVREEHDRGQSAMFRSAPLPAELRKAPLQQAENVYDPTVLGRALGNLLHIPEQPDLSHLRVVRVSLGERLNHLRALLRRGAFLFDEAVKDSDRMTVAVTLFALLELYKKGEADWTQDQAFDSITVNPVARTPESIAPVFSEPEVAAA
jgi:segregation and condensation protein A